MIFFFLSSLLLMRYHFYSFRLKHDLNVFNLDYIFSASNWAVHATISDKISVQKIDYWCYFVIVLCLTMKNLHLQEYLQNYSCSSLAQKAPFLQKDGLNLDVETDPKPIRRTPFVCILVIKLRKIKMQSRKRSNVFPTPHLSWSCSVLPCCRSEAKQGFKLWPV